MKKTIEINNHKFTGIRLLLCACFLSPLAQGEVTLDGSVGPAGALTGPDYKITENLGKRAGSNLFHSFGRFNINASESATFSGSSGIKNVISRVTGGQASNIDGTLRVSIPNANLYLLNPAGVIFGEHAKLDVPGSFHVSTADYLKFQDGVRFDSRTATAPQVLATAEPEAFGFLGENPAGITLTGTTGSVLQVQQGSTISLIGGDITSENTAIYAPGGQINLASVGSAGEVGFNESGIQTTSFVKMGDIQISQDPLVPRTALATGVILANVDASDDTAGKIFIRGGQLVMDNSFVASDTTNGDGGSIRVGLTGDLSLSAPERTLGGLFTASEISASTLGDGNAGSISLDVAGLNLTNRTRINTTAFQNTKGNAGDIIINANTIKLQDDDPDIITQFISSASGDGDAGNITIITDTLEVLGGASINSSTRRKGKGGNLTIKTDDLKVLNGGTIKNISGKEATSKGGDLTIDADNILLSGPGSAISATLEGGGNAGNLTITSGEVRVTNGAIISSSIGNGGHGKGGDLTVKAHNVVVQNGAFITSRTFGTGKLGKTSITANDLQIQNGGQIITSTFGAGKGGDLNVNSGTITISGNKANVFTGLNTEAFFNSKGDAGDLTVTAGKIELQGSAFISALTHSSGDAGNLLVNVDNLTGNDGSLITTQTDDTGNAGNVTVNANHIELNNGSKIDNSTFSIGRGGILTVNANTILLANNTVSERVSGFFTVSRGIEDNAGDSGDIAINANRIEMRDDSLITTRTESSGKGGSLTVNANELLLNNAHLSSISRFKGTGILQDADAGKSGDIQIKLGNTLRLENNSGIDVSTDKANAGVIRINGGKFLHLSDSNITTSVADGEGNGGNISIATPIVALDSSDIIAKAAEGKGGNISISGFLFQSPSSVVNASSELGVDGNIDLKPDTNISGSLAVLPDTFLNASQQMSERCSARSENDLSSFVVKGRGGAPLRPGDLAPSNFLDYFQTEEDSGQGNMNYHSSPNNDRSLSYSDSDKSVQFASSSINCTP